MSLSNLEVLKQSTQWEILSDWSIYLTVLHMDGQLLRWMKGYHEMTSEQKDTTSKFNQIVQTSSNIQTKLQLNSGILQQKYFQI